MRALSASTRDCTFAVGFAALLSLAVAIAVAGPDRSGETAAVFPPWWSEARSLNAAASAGALVATGAKPFIVIVQAPDGAAERLRRAGAWLVFNPGGLAACLAPRG